MNQTSANTAELPANAEMSLRFLAFYVFEAVEIYPSFCIGMCCRGADYINASVGSIAGG